MFRCNHCENYRDKSECREDPTSDYGNICEECADAYACEKEYGPQDIETLNSQRVYVEWKPVIVIPPCFTPLLLCHTDEPYSYIGVWNPELGAFCQLGTFNYRSKDAYIPLQLQPTHWMDIPDKVNCKHRKTKKEALAER